MKPLFVLKMTTPVTYVSGAAPAFRDCLRLSEPSLHRFLKHKNIVTMYWAYSRCLDPVSGAQLEMTAHNLALQVEGGASHAGADSGTASLKQMKQRRGKHFWTGIPGSRSASPLSSGVAELGPMRVRLQMCIAMEQCELGAQCPAVHL